MSESRQSGYAVAVVTGAVAHVRTLRPIAAGALLSPSDLTAVTAPLADALIQALPGIEDVEGGRAARALATGEVVTARLARIPNAVQSGDRVVVRAQIGGVEVTGVAISQQSGGVGDVIRLVNHDSRRALRGRITGKGQVEVVHGS